MPLYNTGCLFTILTFVIIIKISQEIKLEYVKFFNRASLGNNCFTLTSFTLSDDTIASDGVAVSGDAVGAVGAGTASVVAVVVSL